MSFFINNNNPNRPGPICGNPLNGLCEKALIQVTKVFDACVSQGTETGLVLTATGFNPANPTLPLTYISAESNADNPATITNVVITRLAERPNFAQVTGTVTIPLVITYRDANGVQGTASSTFTTDINTTLFVPQPSLYPVTISVIAQFSSQIGTFTGENTFTVTGCFQIITKVTSLVDLLIPTYGYPIIPPCQSTTVSECPGFFDRPIYPSALT